MSTTPFKTFHVKLMYPCKLNIEVILICCLIFVYRGQIKIQYAMHHMNKKHHQRDDP